MYCRMLLERLAVCSDHASECVGWCDQSGRKRGLRGAAPEQLPPSQTLRRLPGRSIDSTKHMYSSGCPSAGPRGQGSRDSSRQADAAATKRPPVAVADAPRPGLRPTPRGHQTTQIHKIWRSSKARGPSARG